MKGEARLAIRWRLQGRFPGAFSTGAGGGGLQGTTTSTNLTSMDTAAPLACLALIDRLEPLSGHLCDRYGVDSGY